MSLQELFEANRLLLYSLFGQVFFLLGIAIALIARRDSEIPLARPLWLLAAFGIAHGLYEWSYVVLPVQKNYITAADYRHWEIFQRPVEALSFFFLFQFGTAAICLSRPAKWLLYVPGLFLLTWAGGYFFLFPSPEEDFRNFSNLADLWARYLLCLPGALLAALALWLQRQHAEQLGLAQIKAHLTGAAAAFFLFALVAGFLVPPADFFPASWLNRRLLSSGLGIPSPIVRAFAGVLIAYFVMRSLKMFEIEISRRLEESRRYGAIAEDRERISRELHDGILQNVYGAGLQLENLITTLPAGLAATRTEIGRVIHTLNRGIRDIRDSIFELNWDEKSDYETKIRELAENVAGPSMTVRFERKGPEPKALPRGAPQHIYLFFQEALSNVAKHSCATEVRVALTSDDERLILCVTDNGVGFEMNGYESPDHPWQHGLKSMRTRASLLAGVLTIESAPGQGTRVGLTLPIGNQS
ncbi:MAG: sensor histidine kinase [Deltaproteobacteria bacterium]|nr:sensor histidine kinase [Deltaproteobacteria bacterium]